MGCTPPPAKMVTSTSTVRPQPTPFTEGTSVAFMVENYNFRLDEGFDTAAAVDTKKCSSRKVIKKSKSLTAHA